MQSDKTTKPSPAQTALLQFISTNEANILYQKLNTTLSVSIVNYLHPSDKDDPLACATQSTLEGWYFTLEMMRHLHDIALEENLLTVKHA